MYKHAQAKPNPPESYLQPWGSTPRIPSVICVGFSSPEELRITSGHKKGEDLASHINPLMFYHKESLHALSWHKRAPAQGTGLLLQALGASSYPVAELQC